MFRGSEGLHPWQKALLGGGQVALCRAKDTDACSPSGMASVAGVGAGQSSDAGTRRRGCDEFVGGLGEQVRLDGCHEQSAGFRQPRALINEEPAEQEN